ncbi:Uncharacterized protein BM_BM17645 [Brugia malayi]|uniref:Uncharacterized protein n=1 Tax=Brugia malayi TaxID=6279 RepID=A0A4E9FHG1_BRUMA|nr:Uncharacterized protein BM_BM17645 [Brugia malayi]VIO96421.1 Uncharacterized protein BM_BM17645 [Brugia malayi]
MKVLSSNSKVKQYESTLVINKVKKVIHFELNRIPGEASKSKIYRTNLLHSLQN